MDANGLHLAKGLKGSGERADERANASGETARPANAVPATEIVRCLRARIAELEHNRNQKMHSNSENHSGSELSDGIGKCFLDDHAYVKEAGSKMVQSSLEKFPSKPDVLSYTPDLRSYTPYIRYTKLDYKVDTFFAVGSPLGVFLALRNVRIGIGNGREYWQDERITEEMPSCRQMLNIFHPFDPVAYRIEPLVCKEYINKRPVIIPCHTGGKRLHIGFQEFTEGMAAHSKAIKNNLNSLRAKTFEHSYISALGAHTNYWRDHDTALFILNHLYRDIPEEAHTAAQQNRRGQRRPVKLFYARDVLDEETPLTFSDRSLVREFSTKAKNIMDSP